MDSNFLNELRHKVIKKREVCKKAVLGFLRKKQKVRNNCLREWEGKLIRETLKDGPVS